MSRKKSRGGIAYRDDLILEAASLDERFSEGQMAVLTKFLFPYVTQIIKNPEQHSIVFPHLGTFHMRVAHAKHRMEAFKKWYRKNPVASRRFKERVRLILKQVENFETKFNQFKETQHEGRRISSAHLKPRYFNIPAYRRGASIEELERRIIKTEDERRKF